MQNLQNKKLIIYDNTCILCTTSVKFIFRFDTKNQFLFTSLQSDAAKNSLLQFNKIKFSSNSILLIENGILFEKSTAVLKIIKNLSPFIKWFYLFILIPKKWRDAVYDFVANHRYKIFKKNASCEISNLELKKRII